MLPMSLCRNGDAGADQRRGPSDNLSPEAGVPSDVLLTRTAARPLTRNDGATLEDLAAPDAPGLRPLHCAGEALDAQRAVAAERLGQFQLSGSVREPQVRVELAAGQLRTQLDGEV